MRHHRNKKRIDQKHSTQREGREMRKLGALVLGGLFGFLAVAQGQTHAPAPGKPSTAPTPKPGTTAKSTATTARAYDRMLLRPALLSEKAPETYQVKFVTTRGDFIVSVTRSWAPVGADRFYNLVKHHFYDNASFFRVVPGFVVQFGLSAYPAVSAAWANANLKDEPVTQSNKRGYLTYAKTSMPNTRSTQIFINLKDNAGLDRQGFSPFGVVDTQGMKVVDMFYDQYGDSTPPEYQDLITKAGKPYLDKDWPKLDSIKTATLVGAAAAPAAKPTAPPKTAAAKPAPAATKPQ
jgi:peptidyl-prolyl cis-trans isomerase A (cyclophilin A)